MEAQVCIDIAMQYMDEMWIMCVMCMVVHTQI